MSDTPVSSMLLVIFASFIGSCGMAFLKAGANRLAFNVPALVRNWRLTAGVGLYVISSAFFVMGLKRGELSILYPLVSLGYIWALLWSRIFFGELMTKAKYAGFALIIAGVVVLNLGR
ncbi:MAG TPA: EamA family transporter [Bryobacteraceae bacterium]|nr:EamA family transporter [Bryobacteraceae bacterium]